MMAELYDASDELKDDQTNQKDLWLLMKGLGYISWSAFRASQFVTDEEVAEDMIKIMEEIESGEIVCEEISVED